MLKKAFESFRERFSFLKASYKRGIELKYSFYRGIGSVDFAYGAAIIFCSTDPTYFFTLPFPLEFSPPAALSDCKAASTILNSFCESIPLRVLLEGFIAALRRGCIPASVHMGTFVTDAENPRNVKPLNSPLNTYDRFFNLG